MDFSIFMDIPIIDSHVHPLPPWRDDNPDELVLRTKAGTLAETIIKGRLSQMCAFSQRDHSALYLKAAYPKLFYIGGYVPWSGETDGFRNPDWPRYIKSLVELGFDGVGEMGSKTVMRDRHKPLNSVYFEGLWESCEANNLPIVCHIGDPEEFWHENLIPICAKERGWGYFRGDYPTLEELYTEIENVLDSHPDLKITFCHLLFMFSHLERLKGFLKDHKNAHIDLAPGVELLYNISRRRDDWRSFFIEYDDRILLGTDIGMSITVPEHLARIWLLRSFIESDEEFYTPAEADDLITRYEEPFIGLDLPKETCEKIYSGNFRRLWGDKPRKLNVDLVITALEKQGNSVVAEAMKTLR